MENIASHKLSKHAGTIGLFLALLIGSLIISFLIATQGIAVGILALVVFIGLPVVFKALTDVEFGFYLLIWYSYFLFYLGRIYPTSFPMGAGVELIEAILLVAILFSEMRLKKRDWSNFNNPVTYFLILTEVYGILQVFNPNAVSFMGWIASVRGLIFDIVAYFILVRILNNLEIIKKFTKFWLFLALFTALYGFYQEFFGFTSFEWTHINSRPETLHLIQNMGILRKFSILSDAAIYGILMAVAGVFCIVLSLGKAFSLKTKIILWVSGLIMFVSMSFSGTRTATVVVPVAMMMYALMHINRKSTLILLMFGAIGFAVIMFGPFSGGVISRIRTAFEPGKDASMNVREFNRKRIQPYIHDHPIGGGPNTTDGEGENYAAGHPLAGFATDGGYLKTALTMGWVGLIIQLAMFFTVISIGVKNYYKARNPEIKALYCAYVCLLFGLYVANYAQSAMWQKPVGVIVFSIFVIMPTMIKYDYPEAGVSKASSEHH